MQVLTFSSTAMKVVQKVTHEEGGEVEAREAAFLPWNPQQVSNIHRGIGKPRESDVLYGLMLECELAQRKDEIFMQDVKAAPEPQSVLFFVWQSNGIVQFCTNNRNFSILTVDTTINLTDFFCHSSHIPSPFAWRCEHLKSPYNGKIYASLSMNAYFQLVTILLTHWSGTIKSTKVLMPRWWYM